VSYKSIVNPIIFLQVHYARLFMERHNLTPEQFLDLDKKKDIIGFLRECYEPFHLTGDEGVLEELDNYINLNRRMLP